MENVAILLTLLAVPILVGRLFSWWWWWSLLAVTATLIELIKSSCTKFRYTVKQNNMIKTILNFTQRKYKLWYILSFNSVYNNKSNFLKFERNINSLPWTQQKLQNNTLGVENFIFKNKCFLKIFFCV